MPYSSTERISFDGQTSTLIITEKYTLLAKLYFEDLIFGANVFNDLLLFVVDPMEKTHQHKMIRLQNKGHGRDQPPLNPSSSLTNV